MIIALLVIYYLSATSRKENFYDRLTNRSWSVSKLLLDTEGYDAERVKRTERNNPLRLHDEKITIINFKNEIIYTSDENGEIELRNNVLERVRLSERVRYREDAFEVLGALYVTHLNRYVVIAAAIDTEGFTHLNKLRAIMIISCLVSLILFFIAGWVYSGRALKPISEVIRQVEDISITSLNLRVPEGNSTDEIGKLEAIHKVGLNRVLIRDNLTDLETFQGYEGVTGKVIWDGAFNNLRPIFMAKVNNGKFEFTPAPPIEKSEVIYKKVKLDYY